MEGGYDYFELSKKILDDDFIEKFVENIVGVHLVRNGNLLYWRGKAGEIDFIYSREPVFIEVKFQEKITLDDIKLLKKLKEGVLVSKDLLDRIDDIYIIAIYLFLSLI